ncbi:MAG: peptidase T [Christensenellales bacterium]|jgi:tripeptide aminopeptidase
MRAYERFLKYIRFDTASREENPCCPSTEGQRVFGEALVRELLDMGIADARIDENGYVYASIPANREAPSIGFIAHMDTVSDVPCMPMRERIIENYDGKDIALENGLIIFVEEFPFLKKYAGKTLIVTDGNTILGADDKAGVAEIMTLAEILQNDPTIPHGKVCIGFTPDEEIGRGADLFDVESFGADFAYTVDGSEIGEINYENFNAASAKAVISGVSIHPGSGKGKLKNAALIAAEFVSLLPSAETPAHTENYEGFFHLTDMQGETERAELRYIIRDHDKSRFEQRKALFHATAGFLNAKYGEGTVSVSVTDSYFNMKGEILPHRHILERAEKAYAENGIKSAYKPIRGGTDGARLTFMGLPCPNLSTAGMNAHGRRECVCVEDMDTMTLVLKSIVTFGL